jgi:hypothetical protein
MTKELFRVRLTGIPQEYEYDRLVEEDRKRTDEYLSKYFSMHTIDMTPAQMKDSGVSPYCRDNFTELGDILVVSTTLLPKPPEGPKHDFQMKFISDLMEIKDNGHVKSLMFSNDDSCHGGFFLECDDFLLYSSKFGMDDGKADIAGLAKPYYAVHQVTTPHNMGLYDPVTCVINESANGHIDTRIGIVPAAKVIYVAQGTLPDAKVHDPLKLDNHGTLKAVCEKYGCELREYQNGGLGKSADYRQYMKGARKFGKGHTTGPAINGINFITDGDRLFTSTMSRGERKYLAGKGVEALEVPMMIGYNGAGLRCAYGEITVSPKPELPQIGII